MNPNTLYILAGIPGCGKSTWAKYFFPEYRIINSDNIRKERTKDGHWYDQSKNGEIFEIFHERIGNLLEHGDAVADSTALEARARRNLYILAKESEANVHVILFKNIVQALERNVERGTAEKGRVPDEQMSNKMLPRFYDTLSVIDDEPWDSLTIIERVNL